jgi:hypothetical protein
LPVFFNEARRPATPPEPAEEGFEFPDSDLTESLPPEQVAEALKLARERWAEAEVERLKHQRPIDLQTPCYFNTGCCSFGDDNITGLEITGGSIRLVRWPCEPPVAPHYLAAAR